MKAIVTILFVVVVFTKGFCQSQTLNVPVFPPWLSGAGDVMQPVVCPNVNYTAMLGTPPLSIISVSCASYASIMSSSYYWEISGGQILDPSTGNFVTSLMLTSPTNLTTRWTSSGYIRVTTTHNIGYNSTSCYTYTGTPKTTSVTMKTPYLNPPLATVQEPIGGTLCAETEVELTAKMDNPNYDYVYEWDYQVNGGAWVNFGSSTSTNQPGSVTTNTTFTVPDFSELNQEFNLYRFRTRPFFHDCVSSGTSLSIPVSPPATIYPAAPVYTIVKSTAICEGDAGITITGSGHYDEVKIRLFREDLLNAVVETVLEFDPTVGFSYSNNAIPAVDHLGESIPYKLQVVNFLTNDADEERCYTEANLTFDVINPVVSVNATISDESCYDPEVGSGQIALTAGGAGITTPLSYEWSTSATTSQISNLHGDNNYQVVVKDANGCKTSPETLSYRIEEPDPIDFSLFNVDDVSCASGAQGVVNDGRIEVVASGGTGNFQYSLDGGTFGNSSLFTGLLPGPHTLQVKDGACIQDLPVNPVVVGQPSSPVSYTAITKTDIQCTGTTLSEGSITVMGASGGSSGYEYSIDGVDYQQSDEFRFLPAGIYTIRVRDSNDCEVQTDQIEIISEALQISLAAKTDLICSDRTNGTATISIEGGSTPYTINWSNGQSSFTATNLIRGDHAVTVVDDNGCEGSSTVTIDSPAPLTIEEHLTPPTCAEDSDGSVTVAALGGNGGYVYQWSDGQSGSSRTNLSVGDYHLIVTDQEGCEEEYDIALLPPVQANLGEDKTICPGQPVLLASNLNGSYAWSADNGFVSTDYEVSVTEPGVYKLVVIDNDGCESEDEIIITQSLDLLNADFLLVSEAHAGDTLIAIDITWPIPENVTWILPSQVNGISTDGDIAEIAFDEIGVYDITMVANLGGCADEYTKQINILEPRENSGGRKAARESLIQDVKLYPNPSSGLFNLQVELREENSIKVSVLTADGNRTLITMQDKKGARYNWDFNLSHLVQGLYFIVIESGTETKALRLIKY